MQRRALGSSGFEISTIGIGTWATGGWMWGGQDDDASVQAIHAAVDHGVNWIDTAPIYGSGHSEAVVGRALRELPAARRPLVFTKFGLGEDSENAGASRRRAREVLAECDASLRRLGVDAIDLYQLHWPVAAADRRDGGRLRRAAGGRQDPRDRRVELLGRAARGMARHRRAAALGAVALQHPAAGGRRRRAALCAATTNLGVIAYSPLFRGMLFGTWKKGKTFADGDTRGAHKDYQGARFDRHLDAVAAAARARRRERPELRRSSAIGVLLHTPGLTGCIVGARSARQGAMIASLGVAVTDDQVAAVERIMASLRDDLAKLDAAPAAAAQSARS